MIKIFFSFLTNWPGRVFIKRILKKKIIFSELKQYDLLIIDEGWSNLDFEHICSFKVIKNEIYFNCLLRAFLKSLSFIGKKYRY